jgi:hypothetical protein
MQTYVGLRSEYNVFAGLARHYMSVELHTRPDKFYLIELERGPRGGYPDTTLVFDPTNGGDQWVRTSDDRRRLPLHLPVRQALRLADLALRHQGVERRRRRRRRRALVGPGLRCRSTSSTRRSTSIPRVKLAAAFELMRGVYVLGGIDEALNAPDTLMVQTGAGDVPLQFEEYRFGRDVFVGGMIRFNDEDLARAAKGDRSMAARWAPRPLVPSRSPGQRLTVARSPRLTPRPVMSSGFSRLGQPLSQP